MQSLQGNILEIIFNNESNGYVVAVLETENDIVTIVGYIPALNEGESLYVEGTWEKHAKFGRQFKVETYKTVIPATINGIEKYLSSGLIPGIGPKIAKKIIEKFGMDAIDILQYNPRKLKEVEGIGEKKAEKIAEAFEEQRELRDIMIFLQTYGISHTYGVKIYKKYGKDTVSKLRENPYRLTDDITGIGFKMADKIAQSMGIDFNSRYRINAGIKFILKMFSGEGHTYVPENKLLLKSKEILEVDDSVINDSITYLAINHDVKVESVDNERCIYYMPYFYAESNVSRKLIELSIGEIDDIKIDLEEEINNIEKENKITLASKQRDAIKQSVNNGVLVVTGGPGTGKTTTINSIIKLFEGLEKTILLAAPTGRATKRMSEATDREAKTIHRLLEYNYFDDEEGMGFSKDDGTPLEADVVIIDEVSMVDILLMNNLLKAIQVGTRLILVGDIDQLPSVGAGNVLRDIIESKAIKVVMLDEIFRQAEESMIVVNAHKINKGQIPVLNKKEKDFFFITRNDSTNIVDTIVDLCKERLPKFKDYDPVKDIQVLTPMRKGDTGVNSLNEKLQEVLNPKRKDKGEKKVGETLYRVGDKVMQIRNNYKAKWDIIENDRKLGEGEGIFNGDFGFIIDMDDEDGELTVLFDDNKEVIYEFSQLDELTLAYATTIHKSQGSEFPVVVMPVHWGPPMLQTRNLLYTAITRAKELVVLVGTEKYMRAMIENNRINKRYSGLERKLRLIHQVFTEQLEMLVLDKEEREMETLDEDAYIE